MAHRSCSGSSVGTIFSRPSTAQETRNDVQFVRQHDVRFVIFCGWSSTRNLVKGSFFGHMTFVLLLGTG